MNTTSNEIVSWSKNHGEPDWLTVRRTSAWEGYQSTPPPPRTIEAWKYTNLEKRMGWDATAWRPETTQAALPTGTRPETVVCLPIGEALAQHPSLVRPYLERPSTFSGTAGAPYGGLRYVHQHEALWDDGLFIFVPRGVTVSVPQHILRQCTAADTALFPRTIVVAEEGAAITVVEEFASTLDPSAMGSCHSRMEYHLAPGSRVQAVAIQRWHAGMRHLVHQHASIDRDAQFTSIAITLGGSVTKSITEAQLTAPGAESFLFGLSFGDAAQQIDHHTLQTHEASNTTSDLLFKAALKDDAKAIYTGLIRMTEHAQQGAAYQSSRNLLLSQRCQANAIPQLEIAANDVKCSHGATMGPVDKEQLYYLMSRGLTRPAAERMVTTGFFEDILTRIPDEKTRDIVRHAIASKLGDHA
jgi:Fe-S cluster assembly protein SufD